MKNIMALRSKNLLTEQQVLTAARFARNPNEFNLAPTLFRIMREVISDQRGLEEIEASRGWPARSAKAIVSILLYAMEEASGQSVSALDDFEAAVKERVKEATATIDTAILALQRKYGLTVSEAKIVAMLSAKPGVAFTKDAIYSMLYSGAGAEDMPMQKVVDVLVCKARKKIASADGSIETVWGQGYLWRKKE